MHSSRIALVTSDQIPTLTESDRVLAHALAARGLVGEPVVWSDPGVRWGAYDVVLVRSPWDYFLRIDEFLGWVDRLEAEGVRLMNPPAVIRWNAHKRYLRELGERGAPVVPSVWLERGAGADLARAVSERGWERVVVKPAVSGGAHETWVAEAPFDGEVSARVAAMLARGDVLVQPFINEIARHGELSLLFMDGRFTHAVRKAAKPGDFRVQVEHGGTFEPADVSEAQVAAAARMLAMAPGPTLYGRVDVVMRGAELLLMELEVLEPDLFFTVAPAAADVLAAAVARAAGDD